MAPNGASTLLQILFVSRWVHENNGGGFLCVHRNMIRFECKQAEIKQELSM